MTADFLNEPPADSLTRVLPDSPAGPETGCVTDCATGTTELAPRRTPKQVLVVRKDLAMQKGKIAAQASHGSVRSLTNGPGAYIDTSTGQPELRIMLDDEAYEWLMTDYRKICVAAASEAHLLELHRQALEAGLRCSLVQDNGLTQFKGVKTYTALVIGPHYEEKLDPITRGLPLL